jgi:hypothetical protein
MPAIRRHHTGQGNGRQIYRTVPGGPRSVVAAEPQVTSLKRVQGAVPAGDLGVFWAHATRPYRGSP